MSKYVLIKKIKISTILQLKNRRCDTNSGWIVFGQIIYLGQIFSQYLNSELLVKFSAEGGQPTDGI